MGREEGGGFRMGNTDIPVADSFQCLAKLIQCCKVSIFYYSLEKLGIFRHTIARMEKAMATHSSTLAWKIPWTEESDRLQSMGSLGVGYG